MILILSFIPNQKISNNLFLKKAKFQRQTLHGQMMAASNRKSNSVRNIANISG